MTQIRPPLVRLLLDLDDEEAIVDGFAGGGGTSEGIEMAVGRPPDIAINHDAEALAMHRVNHPKTRHIRTNIRRVHFGRVLRGRRCALGWFSPDCTFHSKARGGKPFRDRNRARRIRGLAWEAVRFVVEVKRATGRAPRVVVIENVEEFRDWCPLDRHGRPDKSKRGQTFERWCARLRNLGGRLEHRELVACDYGAPTKRKRLFVIIRFDGRPIVWPEPTHGPKRAQPYATAAECIDWSIPVPSIFLTPAQAKRWAKAHGVATPKRPLVKATKRRIARGVMRYVVNSPDPFLVAVRHHDNSHIHPLDGPVPTIPASDRELALVVPILVNNSELRGDRAYAANEPIRTLTAAGCRTYQLVAAFLAKHHGRADSKGHEATGQRVTAPIDTIITRENKSVVAVHLLKFRGGLGDHPVTAQDLREPVPALTAQGNHCAAVYAFLVKYYGTKKDGCRLQVPIDTLTTKDRFGLVTVTIAGEEYALVDIGMRILTPRELFRAQGFPDSYVIDCTVKLPRKARKRLTKKAQTRLVGNSVPPHLAAAIVSANLGAADVEAAA